MRWILAVALLAGCAGNPCPNQLTCSNHECCPAGYPYECGSSCYASPCGSGQIECVDMNGTTTQSGCHALGLLCCGYGCPTNKCCPSSAPYGCGDNLGTWDCFATASGASYEVTNGVCRSSIGGSGSYFLCN